MLIGMVLSQNKKVILPFTEGHFVRVYNKETGASYDEPNPALNLTEGRRGAVIDWFNNNGVELICSPPGTHCELSYQNAQEKNMKYYRLQPNTAFDDFLSNLNNGEITIEEFISENEILPSRNKAR